MDKYDELQLQKIYTNAFVEKFYDERRVILKEMIRELYISNKTVISQLKLDHLDRAFSKYRDARHNKNIENPKQYFKACILSAIKETCLYSEIDEFDSDDY